MIRRDIVRRLSGAFRNAVVWGSAWFILASATTVALRGMDGVPAGIVLGDAIVIGVKVGFIGGIAGAAFAGFISFLYRGRRLSDISWVRFGVGGGIVAGTLVPAFLVAGNLLSGDGFPSPPTILDDLLMAAAFGAVAAGGSMKLAQRADVTEAGSNG